MTGPNFLIVGAAKSGTTSLCHYLRQHPDVFVAREKESHHFLVDGTVPSFHGPGDDTEFVPLIIPDRARYEQCFAPGRSSAARGEASVYYLCEPAALERALAYDPAMRFVVVLRNPVERTFSAWSHMMRDGREPERDFLAALEQEPQRTVQGWSYGFRYAAVSSYCAQVAGAQQVVPADQLHVLLYDDLVQAPDRAMAALFDFLAVPPSPVDSSLVMNASGQPRLGSLNRVLTQRNPIKEGLKRVLPYRLGSSLAQRLRNWNLQAVAMSERDRAHLQDLFAADTEDLGRLLGRDLSAWLPARRL